MYLMKGDDFFTTEQGRYQGMGIDRLATLRAAGDFKGFPALVFDGGTAMTYTAADVSGKILGGGIGPGIQVKLRSLSDYASALPHITVDALMKELAELTDEDGNTLKTLPVFARTPKQNIITTLCREIASAGQSVIHSFLATVESTKEKSATENNDEVNTQEMKTEQLVIVTGGDADVIYRLLQPDCCKLIEVEPGRKTPSPPKYKVKKMKHMVHYGIAGALNKQALATKSSPTAEVDNLLIGLRIAKKFTTRGENGDFIFRGTVACIHPRASKYPYAIRYDDGDAEDLSVTQLYGTFCVLLAWVYMSAHHLID